MRPAFLPRARRPFSWGGVVVLLGGLGACVHEREKVVARLEEGALAPRGERGAAARPEREGVSRRRGWGAFDRGGPDRAEEGGGAGEGDGRVGREGSPLPSIVPASVPVEPGEAFRTAVAAPEASEPTPIVTVARAPSDDGGVRVERGPRTGTSSAAPAHRALPAGMSLERIAKEKFLAADTQIRAEKVTLYVPASYAAEASLTGASVVDEGSGRRTAVGGARLVLRRLTIHAERLTLVAKSDPAADVQLSARGDVSLRSDQPASIVEESGLRSLLLRNDGYTPLR